MITLGTGLPGNGKTLFMLWYLKRKADKEKREVYYHNVKDLNAQAVGNWQTFDPEKWYELPHGSIVLIDECQDIFGKKPNGAALPEHYTKLNTHRHLGIDLFLITQHPTLIDNSVRRLVGQHFHSIRKFGFQRSTIYEWSTAAAAPELPSSQKNAVAMKWKFPKEVFGWYKSAEVHTVKRAVPAKLVLACLFVVGVFGYGYYALDQFQQRGKSQDVQTASTPAFTHEGVVPVADVALPARRPGYEDPVADAQQYMFNQTPRVENLPETAPRYDGLTVPTRVPVPAMCVQIGDVQGEKPVRCQCYTQQATKMDIEFNMCISIARNGRFIDFDPEPMRRDQDRAERSAAILSKEPNLPPSSSYQAGRVIAFSDVPSGMQGARPPSNLDDGPPPGRITRTEVVQGSNGAR